MCSVATSCRIEQFRIIFGHSKLNIRPHNSQLEQSTANKHSTHFLVKNKPYQVDTLKSHLTWLVKLRSIVYFALVAKKWHIIVLLMFAVMTIRCRNNFGGDKCSRYRDHILYQNTI